MGIRGDQKWGEFCRFTKSVDGGCVSYLGSFVACNGIPLNTKKCIQRVKIEKT